MTVPAGRLRIERVAEIDSTNDELLRRDPLLPPSHDGRSGDGAEALWLIARSQTRGRGRHRRRWHATPEASLTASFGREADVLPGSVALGALPLAVGVAIAESLAPFGVDLWLKWPNDLYVALSVRGERFAKAGGILCELRARGTRIRIVIGCGLNLRAPPASVDLGQPVTGLFDGRPLPDHDLLAQAIGLALLEATDLLLAHGFEPFRSRWSARDLLRGRSVAVHRDGATRVAVAHGIADDGALLVDFDGRCGDLTRLLAEEVSIRPLS